MMRAILARLCGRKAPAVTPPKLAEHVDPFAGHPMQCRCTFHR